MELKLNEVTKKYGQKVALDRFSYTFGNGIYGILGANGAGKSTLMNLITDNVKRDGGEILYNGTDVLKLGDAFRAQLGFMPQQQGVYEGMTAETFLAYMARLKKLPGKRIRGEIARVLELTNLSSVRLCALQLNILLWLVTKALFLSLTYIRKKGLQGIMKKSKVRQLAVILLTVIVLSSAACARKADGPVPGEREAEEDRGAWASFPMGVFYDGILYFYPESSPGGNEIVMDFDKKIVMAADLDTLETFPLCGKPECTHGRSGGCNAVLDGSVQEVFTVYNGRLYWVAMIKQRHFLYSAELDGSNHREVTELDHELEMHMGGGLICICNDRLYRLGTGSCIVNGAVVDTVTLYEQPLEKNSRPNVILRLEQPSNVMMKLAGGTLYAAVYDVGEEGLKAHHVTLIAYDTEAGAFDVLFDGSAPCGADDMLVAQDGKSILFSSGPELFSFSLEDKSFSVLLDTGDAGFASDGMRFIITSKTGFRCADHEDNTVFEGELQAEGSDPEGSYLKRYIGFYKGCFYLSLDSWKDDGWRILRIDPQNKKVELVCSGRGNSVTSGS